MGEVRYMISEAAKKLQVESHVLRYWEDELGLEIGRTDMGHRCYTEDDIQLFLCIQKLKNEGMLLRDLKFMIPELTAARKRLNAARTEDAEEDVAGGVEGGSSTTEAGKADGRQASDAGGKTSGMQANGSDSKADGVHTGKAGSEANGRTGDIQAGVTGSTQNGMQAGGTGSTQNGMQTGRTGSKSGDIQTAGADSRTDDIRAGGADRAADDVQGSVSLASAHPAAPEADVIQVTQLEQVRSLIGDVLTDVVSANNETLKKDISRKVTSDVIREMDFLFQANERREEEHYRKLDVLIRQQQAGRREAARETPLGKLKKLLT
ncbi:MAG: MerR family transcriptional regulator [Schaedlerella sp.]|uniref:MerR family transcriptional regulator n=1 Tax=Schaedlerella sp. TaxID=2676057 RepID=UPI00260E76BA|nr:MerR family transcriptional regulator [uncultured Schaedlerella sp.]